MSTSETSTQPKIRDLPIFMIHETDGTQCRAQMSPDTVERYRAVWLDGGRFPPIDVYHDGETFYLADGFHRLEAARQAGLKKVSAKVHEGSRRDAMLHAIGANAEHGLPRTNEDKRRAVDMLLSDPEWQRRSNGWLAKAAAVSKPFIAKRRRVLGLDGEAVTGLDGKEYGAASDDGDDGDTWDPWEGREGDDARAFLETVDDWRLAELLMKRPPRGLKTRVNQQFEALKRLALGTWYDLRHQVEAGMKKEHGPWFWSAVNRRILQLPLYAEEPLGLEALKEEAATLTSFVKLERLIRVPLMEDPEQDKEWRIKLLRLHVEADSWRFRSMYIGDKDKADQCELLRPLCPAFADHLQEEHRKAKQIRREADSQSEKERAERHQAERIALAGVVAGAPGWTPDDLTQPLESHVTGKLLSQLRWPGADVRPARHRIGAVLAKHFALSGSPVEVCPDPVCGSKGGWRAEGTQLGSFCWRCDRPKATSEAVAAEHLAYVQELIRIGHPVELDGAEPAAAPPSASPPSPAPGARLQVAPPVAGGNADTCPICFTVAVGLQTTVDRGEVLAEHPLPFDDGKPCPGSFLALEKARSVINALDSAAPEVVRILTGLERVLSDKRICQAVGPHLAHHAPALWSELEAWSEDKHPGSAHSAGGRGGTKPQDSAKTEESAA